MRIITKFGGTPLVYNGHLGVFDWNAQATKVMGLFEESGTRVYPSNEYYPKGAIDNITDNIATAMHEFGHMLGLQDAYLGQAGNKDEIDFSVMRNQYDNFPSNNDIEMVILAFATGQRQNFVHQFPWENISDAIGRGN